MDSVRKAEWLASELQDVREKVQQSTRYAFGIHEVVLNDIQSFENRKQAKSAKIQEGISHVRTK